MKTESELIKKTFAKHPSSDGSSFSEAEIIELCNLFHMSGFILSSNILKKDSPLYKNVLRLNNNYIARKILMKKDLDAIKEKFLDDGIRFVVLKGCAYDVMGIFPMNERHYRDIDIIVKEEDIKKAHQSIKEIGYKYKNNFANNDCIYLGNHHHLPAMINKNKTVVEIHHRITKPSVSQDCIITKDIFKKSVKINGLEIPDFSTMVAHSLHHSFQQHSLSQGPIFIFDILHMIKFSKTNSIDISFVLLDKLNLSDNLSKFLNLLDYLENSSCKAKDISKNLSNIGYKGYKSHDGEPKIVLFGKLKRKKDFRLGLGTILLKIQNTKYKYQARYSSLKFIFLLIFEFFLDLKKIKFFN
ncbi:MAG: nucleotidyltransferase family protein [SAR86 cluster bacterium]|nr:nucleotidyltransferase family protein [SAR86 cluster bacterium]